MVCFAPPIPIGFFKPVTGQTAKATFTDNFTRANANPMSTTASDGNTWTSGEGAFSDCQILLNSLEGTSGTSGCRVLTPTFANNQSAEMTFAVGGAVTSMGIMVRVQGVGDGSGYLLFADSLTQLTIYKVTDSGSIGATPIGASYTVATMLVGDKIKLEATGTTTTTLKAYLNGVSIGTERTDSSSPYTGGNPGTYFSAASHFITLFTATDL